MTLFTTLSLAFDEAARRKPLVTRAVVNTIDNVGNWRSIFDTIKERLSVKLEAAATMPVVVGEEEAVYLKGLGPRGAIEFREHVRKLLRAHDRIFVFDAQDIECLKDNPECVLDLLGKGQVASMFYREALHPGMERMITENSKRLSWHQSSVGASDIGVVAASVSQAVLDEIVSRVAEDLAQPERDGFSTVASSRETLLEIRLEAEDRFLRESFGVPKLREFVRRRLIVAALKATTPVYSAKSGEDPLEFFDKKLRKKFERYGLPNASLSEVSPTLNFIIKANRRSGELGSDHRLNAA